MDQIKGKVVRVIDGDTFDVRVTHVKRTNQYNYNDFERIRIAKINASELGTAKGSIAKRKLLLKLNGRSVLCSIRSRDVFGRLIADFKTIS